MNDTEAHESPDAFEKEFLDFKSRFYELKADIEATDGPITERQKSRLEVLEEELTYLEKAREWLEEQA